MLSDGGDGKKVDTEASPFPPAVAQFEGPELDEMQVRLVGFWAGGGFWAVADSLGLMGVMRPLQLSEVFSSKSLTRFDFLT